MPPFTRPLRLTRSAVTRATFREQAERASGITPTATLDSIADVPGVLDVP